MKNDMFFMRLALNLAKKGKGITHPNPTVGSVIVKNGNIIGKGFHKGAGNPHAEIEAINDALSKGYDLKGSTIYITLEPCCHYGRTPPCTDALIRYGFKRVVIGVLDPNPAVAGKGIKMLKQKGIDVKIGILEDEAREINEDFFVYITEKRPFVHLKLAQTLDGKIATYLGISKWITGEKSRKLAHRLRKEAGSVLVGVNTVLADDPHLTVRHIKTSKQPVRIVLDKNLKSPVTAKVFDEAAKSIVITSIFADKEKIKVLEDKGVQVKILNLKNGKFDIKELLNLFYSLGFLQIFIEGGGSTVSEFIKSGFVDRISLFIAPKIVGNDGIPSVKALGIKSIDNAVNFKINQIKRLGEDLYLSLKPIK